MNTINKILQIYTSKTPYSIHNSSKGFYLAGKIISETNQATQGRGRQKNKSNLTMEGKIT